MFIKGLQRYVCTLIHTDKVGQRTLLGLHRLRTQLGNRSLKHPNSGLIHIPPLLSDGLLRKFLSTGSQTREMSSARNGITFRKAVLADKEEVLSLGKTIRYGDYLFGIFSDVVEDEESHPIVAVENGKVVGFCMTTLLDGGVTIMQRSGRVAETQRGRGLFRMMREELTRHTAEHRPDLLFEAFVTSEKTDYLLDHYLNNGFKPIYRKGVTFKSLDESVFSTLKNSKLSPHCHIPDVPITNMSVHEMSRQDLSVLIQAERSEAWLFSKQRIFNFLLSYRLLNENIPALLFENGGGFYSMSIESVDTNKNSEHHQNSRSISTDSKNFSIKPLVTNTDGEANIATNLLSLSDARDIAMVTFYRTVLSRIGYLYSLDVYTTPQMALSRDHLIQHLQRHLVIAQRQFPNKNGVLALTFDLHISKDMIESCLDEMGNRETIQADGNYVLYEKNFQELNSSL